MPTLNIHEEGFFAKGENHPLDTRSFKKPHVFKEDYRGTNPGLHFFYFTSAIQHLREVDKAIATLSEMANGNLLDLTQSMFRERRKLVHSNAAYAEADILLRQLGLTCETKVVLRDDGSAVN
jgi:hypothetical protein